MDASASGVPNRGIVHPGDLPPITACVPLLIFAPRRELRFAAICAQDRTGDIRVIAQAAGLTLESAQQYVRQLSAKIPSDLTGLSRIKVWARQGSPFVLGGEV